MQTLTPANAGTTSWTITRGDCLRRLRALGDESVHSVITDPPYELNYHGHAWDRSGIAYSVDLWRECLRVLKPGGHLIAFGASRTTHRVICAIEDAGFDIRDVIAWHYSTGMPKGRDIAKAIDQEAGATRPVLGRRVACRSGLTGTRGSKAQQVIEITGAATDEARQWEGWNTALKPATEPIVLARKPLDGTVAANMLMHGVGGLNVGACRYDDRWPSNVIADEAIASTLPMRGLFAHKPTTAERDAGLPARRDSRGNTHSTVKPIDLMRYLVRLVTPPGGIVLDPFNGSGTTGCAATMEGCSYVGFEQSPEYARIARRRIKHWAPPTCVPVAA